MHDCSFAYNIYIMCARTCDVERDGTRRSGAVEGQRRSWVGRINDEGVVPRARGVDVVVLVQERLPLLDHVEILLELQVRSNL